MRATLTTLLVLFAAANAAAAQNDALPDSVAQPYLAYENAMESEDYASALLHAESAWRAADRSEIDRALTGILAGNYGHLAQALENPEAAYEGWRAAAEISDEIGAPAAERVNNWHQAAMAAFQDGDTRESVACSRMASNILEAAGHDSIPVNIVDGHYYLATSVNFTRGRYRDSKRLAQLAVSLRDARGDASGRIYADLHYIAALSSLPRYDWAEAYEHLHAARFAYNESGGSDRIRIVRALLGWIPSVMDRDDYWPVFQRVRHAGFETEDGWHQDAETGTRFLAITPSPSPGLSWLRRDLSGELEISFSITPEGRATDIVVERNTLDAFYENVAIERTEEWQFAADTPGAPIPELGRQTRTYRYLEGRRDYAYPPRSGEGPRPIERVEPQYPLNAAENGVAGLALVSFDVADDGSVENIRTVLDLPPGYFSEASEDAVRQWQYEPIREGEAREHRSDLVTEFIFQFAD